ncbi:MAG TPA: protein-glutamate O-methyltransferase CheR [Spirochaetota bacterium]|nr:protein-glutamate O-methyltransferase CheR [Spirochaetota bacterium]
MEFVKLSEQEFSKFSQLIHDIAGIYLKDSKLTLLSNRLRKRLKEKNFESFDDYYNYIKNSQDQIELNEMLNAVSTNETYFFRNSKHYDALLEKIIPEMISKRRTPIKIWSAGCSSGEEAFTLCMLLDEKGYLERSLVEIYGSDINTSILDEAKKGVYDDKRLRTTPDRYKNKYFNKIGDDLYELDRKIVNFVKFGRINLKLDKFETKYDIIFCRNVMIYFEREDQQRIVEKFYNALNNDSYFIIGHSESLYFINNAFKYMKISDAPIYYKE